MKKINIFLDRLLQLPEKTISLISKICFVLFLCSINIGKSQVSVKAPINPGSSPVSPPDIIPPSPEASAITQYGSLPLNEYKGMSQINIPLLNIMNGDIQHPISLDYAKLGVKVNDISGNVGVSWILNSGGVITRSIEDIADELAPNRLMFADKDIINNLNNTQDGTDNAQILNHYLSTTNYYDKNVDIYRFSFGGNSGSFFLDSNLNPQILEGGPDYKIECDGNLKQTNRFIITYKNGIKYYFGGENATERTYNHNNPLKTGITSYYLTEIKDTKNNSVNFQYETTSNLSFILSEEEQQLLSGTYVGSAEGSVREMDLPQHTQNSNILHISSPKILKQIIYNNNSVVFNYDNNTGGLSYKKLISIDLIHFNNNFQTIDFNYLDQNNYNQSLERFFLTNVKFYNYHNTNKVFHNEYIFEYNNPSEIPSRLSKSIDLLGYYNGKSNSTLLPNLNKFGANFPEEYGVNYSMAGLADRTPDFKYAINGTLKSIIYPTKGKSEFEYEAIPVKEDTQNQLRGTIMADYKKESKTISGSLFKENIVNIQVYFEQTNPLDSPARGRFTIKDDLNNLLIDKPYRLRVSADTGKPITINEIINLDIQKERTYTITLESLDNINTYGFFSLNYISGFSIKNYLNIRLKMQKDISESKEVNLKRLYYSDIENIHNTDNIPYKNQIISPGYFVSNYFNQALYQGKPESGVGNYITTIGYYANLLNTSPNTNLTPNDITDMSYPKVVISYGGDNFEKGGEEKEFKYNNYVAPVYIRNPNLNTNSQTSSFNQYVESAAASLRQSFLKLEHYNKVNGNLVRRRIFKKINDNFFIEKKEEYEYEVKESDMNFNLAGARICPRILYTSGINAGNEISNFFIAYTPVFKYVNNLMRIKTTEYLENTPLFIKDDNAYKKLVTTTVNTYNNPLHNQINTSKSISPDNSIIETNHQYAHEKGNQYLIDKNMIGIPLQTSVTQKQNDNDPGKTISKSEILYPTSQADANTRTSGLALPVSVLGFDLQNPEDAAKAQTELTYDLYDNKGNILQYSVKGKPVTVIWGYSQTQPIAKIEGAAYNQVSAYVSAIIAASDADNTQGTDQSEQALIGALDILRNNTALSAYQITTYTYNPLIGVTSITPPSGIREIYKYDSANRLESVKDVNGNLLKEYQYRYKN